MNSSMPKWFLLGCVAVAALSAPRAIECVRNGIGGPYRAGVVRPRPAAVAAAARHEAVSTADAGGAQPRRLR